MSLTESEIVEIQEKYKYLTNYESAHPDDPINPLTYVDSNGDCLLHIAAQRADERTILLLLQAGADVNALGDMGNTALHYATNAQVANLLLSHGASVEIYNEFGRKPLFNTKT